VKVTCGIVFVLAIAACGGGGSSSPDGGGGDGDGATDASPHENACRNSTTLELPGGDPYAAVSDGTTAYVALSTTSTDQLYAIPLVGGPATLIATASEGKFALSSSGGAVFYAAKLGGADYEVHQRVGTTDDILSTIASTTQLVIAANATDVYTAGTAGGDVSVMSLSRTGQPDQVPVAIATSSGNALRLVVGSTIVAWLDTEAPIAWRATPFANPGAVTSITSPSGGAIEIAGDVAISLAGMIQTSHTTFYTWSLIYPVTEVIGSSNQTGHWFRMRGADATHLFVEETYRPTPGLFATETRLMSYALDGSHHFAGQSELCNYAPKLVGQDALALFAAEESAPGVFSLVVIPI
jgi:hypothetical protein